MRRGIEIVRRTDTLRRAFVLAAVLNLAAWPVLSILPAAAHDIDARAHVLGLLTGAFYAGAAAVSWAVVRLRRRFAYGTVLFAGFLERRDCSSARTRHSPRGGRRGTTPCSSPGVTLIPIGLAVALDSSLLQVLVQLGTEPDDQAPVLVVYATVTTIVTPIGGLLIGAIADELSLWGALGVSGLVITLLAVGLRRRLRVFDGSAQRPIVPAGEVAPSAPAPHAPARLRRPGHAR